MFLFRRNVRLYRGATRSISDEVFKHRYPEKWVIQKVICTGSQFFETIQVYSYAKKFQEAVRVCESSVLLTGSLKQCLVVKTFLFYFYRLRMALLKRSHICKVK